MNFATQTADILMPQQHMYMEMTIQAQGQRQTYSFFEAGDVQDACGDWQKIAHTQAGTCHKVGTDTVNGRSAVEVRSHELQRGCHARSGSMPRCGFR